MRKHVWIALALALCLILSACGASEAVKNVEAQINALGEISAESETAIQEAEQAYNSLTEAEKGKVSNYDTLTAARNRLTELQLVGVWYYNSINYWDFSTPTGDEIPLTLNADGTYTEFGYNGTWSVTDGKVITEWSTLAIREEDGKTYLTWADEGTSLPELISAQDYSELVDANFLVIDLAETDIQDVCGFYIQEFEERNDWDEPTGNRNICIMLSSKLYDQGWYCYQTGDQVAIEVLIPEYTQDWNSGGYTGSSTIEATTQTAYGFDSPVTFIGYSSEKDDYSYTSSLTADQLSFGRAKGKLYFVNKNFITQERWQDQYSRILETIDPMNPEIYAPGNKMYWSPEHPF